MRPRRGGVGGGSHQVAAGRLVGTLLKDARHAVRLKVPNVGTEAVPVRESCNVEAFQVSRRQARGYRESIKRFCNGRAMKFWKLVM